jgi:hypothetical protein
MNIYVFFSRHVMDGAFTLLYLLDTSNLALFFNLSMCMSSFFSIFDHAYFIIGLLSIHVKKQLKCIELNYYYY